MVQVLLLVSAAGALGGLLNALLGGSGFILPRLTQVSGSNVVVPGFLGNVLTGAVAAVISFGLYGPFSGVAVVTTPAVAAIPTMPVQLTLAALAGAALVGFSGSRWLTAESDRRFNHATAVATSQLAENLAKAGQPQLESVAVPTDQPTVTPSQIRSLSASLRTKSPLEAYEEAGKLAQSQN
ncbi:hypothetical protein OJF2_25070 [Aquisphaera giovannonii]|uniref:Transmembrane protein n=1 Tax=Aquisphaera giovannonii TaxID=406548 RepID=A0A5B9W166_9BACT|nr:hypothetical protein [Aquisphaera giovannonii]QEH33974.1 hypothetical protein OJF2_25070 [Aquisphaera giovannonii]